MEVTATFRPGVEVFKINHATKQVSEERLVVSRIERETIYLKDRAGNSAGTACKYNLVLA